MAKTSLGRKALSVFMAFTMAVSLNVPTAAWASGATDDVGATTEQPQASTDSAEGGSQDKVLNEEDEANTASQTLLDGDEESEVTVQSSDTEDTRPELVKGDNDVFKEYIQNTELVATLTDDGTLTITGTGDMPNWQNQNTDEAKARIDHTSHRPWVTKNSISKIVIGPGITRVGDLSFWGTCTNVTKIILPDSLKEIGHASFSQQSPNTIIVPSGTNLSRMWAFGPATSNIVFLGDCDVSNTGGKIQYNYNNENTGFTALVGESQSGLIASLKKDVTCNNVDVQELLGPCGGDDGYTNSVYYAYKDGTLTISGSGSMRDYSTEKAPWSDAKIENIVIEDGVTSIGENAFVNNPNLKSVSMPVSVTSIGNNAFDINSCKSEKTSFAVAKGSNAESWLTAQGLDPNPELDEYGRPHLKLDTGEQYKDYIGTTSLVATLTDDNTLTISGSGAMPAWVNTTGASNYFSNRPWQKYESQVQKIVIGDGVTAVGNLSFYLCCSNVKEIVLSDSVETIGHAAFSWQQKLASVVVPEQVKYMSSWSFAPSVKEIYFLGANNLTSNQNLLYNYNQSPSYSAHCLEGSKTASFVENDATHASGATKTYKANELGACGVSPYSSSVYYAYDSNTKTLSILGSGSMMDYSESNLAPWANLDVRSVVIAEGVNHVGSHAFCGNANLSYVSVASDSATVGEHAFDTENLGSIYFLCSANSEVAAWVISHGGSLATSEGSCGDDATWKLEGSTLTISGKGSVRDYAESDSAPWSSMGAFIDSITIDSGIEAVGDYAFAGLNGVTAVSIPATVSKIGKKAFANCDKLSSISLPEHTKQIAEDSFVDCAETLAVTGYQTTVAAFEGKLQQGRTTIKVKVPTRLKVLFVGNSFSQNAVNQLDQIARSAGVEETLVANLHKSAHPVSGYVANITSKNDEYQYRERGTLADTTHNSDSCNLDYGLTAQDWDIVVLQPYCWQSYSKENGPDGEQFKSTSGYANIKTLADYVKANASNPETKLAFYQIWSRPFDYLQFDSASDHVWDGGYIDGVSSQLVWKKILDAYDYENGESPFSYYVPVGTAIENARLTSLEESPIKSDVEKSYKDAVGSGLNADNIHLNAWGCYIDGLTFTKALAGISIDDVTYKPSGMTDGEATIAKAAVDAAFDNPSKNTQGNVDALTYAKVNDTSYSTLADAVAAAKPGDTLELFGMPKSDSALSIAAGVTVKTYGSQAAHTIVLASGGTVGASGLVANGGAVVDGTVSAAPVSIDAVAGTAVTQNAASWNGSEYASVQEAIDAAAQGDCTSENPVKLLCNVAEPVTIAADAAIVLDLNGYTLSNSASAQDKTVADADRHHTITNNGTLTILDSSENHAGVVDNVSHARGALWNNAGATVTVKGGTFMRSAESGVDANDGGGNSWYTIKNYGTMTIDGANVVVKASDSNVGKFSSLIANGWQNSGNAGKSEPALSEAGAVLNIDKGLFEGGLNTVKNDDYGTLNITGGTFNNQVQAAVQNWNVATISGGEFTVSDSAEAVLLNGATSNTSANAGKLTVSGGTFTASENATLIAKSNSDYSFGTAEISDGTFKGSFATGLSTDGSALTVSGGTFSDESFKEYCEDGFEPSSNSDGTYSPQLAKGWTSDVAGFGKDSAPDATELGYTADEAEGLAFAGWYTSDADDAVACASDATGKAYAKFVKVSDLITFKGGSLRMDLGNPEELTYLRFGYSMSIPQGTKFIENGWYYKKIRNTQDGDVRFVAYNNVLNSDGSVTANLVFNGVTKNYYETVFSEKAFVKYETADGTEVEVLELPETESGYQMRSVNDVANAILDHPMAGEVEKAYAKKILGIS